MINIIHKALNFHLKMYAYNKACKGYLLAQHIQSNLVQHVKMLDRGVKTANFAVLRDTAMPAALVELGFLSNAMEEQIMLDRAWQPPLQ